MDTTMQAFLESETITTITRDVPTTVTIHPTRTAHYQATKSTATVRSSASLAHNAQRPLDVLCIPLVYEIFGTSETGPVSLEVVSKTRMAVSAAETGVHPSSTRDSQETRSSMNGDGGKFAAAAISGFVAGCLLTVVTLALIWWRRRRLRRTTSIGELV
ncbi:hypothetical protein NM688_g6296 [Phlebia brevispora]|uniref:Uncharacterized protein n=1 Tax=Phlebia brevispora TaxID=194682 RepID=A0ACC1SHW2_9APHY|nr:hypothetical protein NM688_g6296 [Phlebia brevispora]